MQHILTNYIFQVSISAHYKEWQIRGLSLKGITMNGQNEPNTCALLHCTSIKQISIMWSLNIKGVRMVVT